MSYKGPERRKMTELQEVMSSIDDLHVSIALVTQKLESSHKAFRDFEAETKRRTDSVFTTVYGNGQVGLTTKISTIEELGKNFKEHDKNDRFVQFSLLAGVLGILVKVLLF